MRGVPNRRLVVVQTLPCMDQAPPGAHLRRCGLELEFAHRGLWLALTAEGPGMPALGGRRRGADTSWRSGGSGTAGVAWPHRWPCCWQSAWWSRASLADGRSGFCSTATASGSKGSTRRSSSPASCWAAWRSQGRPGPWSASGPPRSRWGVTACGARRTSAVRLSRKGQTWAQSRSCWSTTCRPAAPRSRLARSRSGNPGQAL